MRKLVLSEVAPDKVVQGESYLVLTTDDEFVHTIAGAMPGFWISEGVSDIHESEVQAIFEVPRKNKIVE